MRGGGGGCVCVGGGGGGGAGGNVKAPHHAATVSTVGLSPSIIEISRTAQH